MSQRSSLMLLPFPPATPLSEEERTLLGERIALFVRSWVDSWFRTMALLEEILKELRRQTLARARVIQPKWLTIAEAARYTAMSEKWVRSLEPVSPRGLFTRVKGTVFVSRAKLDGIFEGKVRLKAC